MFPPRVICLALMLAGLLGQWETWACNVPVFRYALERWNSDPYVLVVYHREGFTPDQQGAIDEFVSASRDRSANLIVREARLGQNMPQPFQELWKAQNQPTLPWAVVRYPAPTGIEPSLWSGPLQAQELKTLLDSPARRELSRRLLRGDTAVWLLVESGDKSRDDALARLLETESKRLEQRLELPRSLPDDPPLTSALPLKVAFSTLRIGRSDPGEHLFIDQLLNWDPRLKATKEPLLFPVFGRGRVLPPALGEGIGPGMIETVARLLTGPCSCQIKQMNAGFDLLLAANWNALAGAEPAGQAASPPLVGWSQFAPAATNHPNGTARAGQGNTPVSRPMQAQLAGLVTAQSPGSETRGDALTRNLVAGFGVGVLFLGATTVVLRARSKKARR